MENINRIAAYLLASHGIDISGYDPSFVEKSIERRCSHYKDSTRADYLHLLTTNPEEVDLFADSLHNSYTEFFRNPLTFSCLEQLVLPVMMASKNKRKENSIRIWSAACASGPEAYSLAILLDELNENSSQKIKTAIFATDNNRGELGKAMEGIYPASAMNKVTLKRVNTYFTNEGEYYHISPRLKDTVDFSWFDLLSDSRSCPEPSIYGNFDLVVCSNLLFYYKPELRLKILNKLENTMVPGAYLVTSETEREYFLQNNYHELFGNSAIFQKKFK